MTHREFLHSAIKEFQYNYEAEINRVISAYYNNRKVHTQDSMNLFFLGFNNEKLKYIIRQIPVYVRKNCFGEYSPMYDYGTYQDSYYEDFDEAVREYCCILRNQITYDVHDLWTDGELQLDVDDIIPYKFFHYDNPHTYFGRINEPYLWFCERWGEYIWKKILMTCSGLSSMSLKR